MYQNGSLITNKFKKDEENLCLKVCCEDLVDLLKKDNIENFENFLNQFDVELQKNIINETSLYLCKKKKFDSKKYINSINYPKDCGCGWCFGISVYCCREWHTPNRHAIIKNVLERLEGNSYIV